jgi:DNA-binding MarR family transcriptional regulator
MAQAGKEQLIDNILSAADKLFRQLLPTIPREVSALDVTMAQFKIMLILYIDGPTRMSDIASQLEVTMPTATSLVERLVEKDYVARENLAEDRRVVMARLSPQGKRGIDSIWESARATCHTLLEGLDTSLLKSFNGVLKDMAKGDGGPPQPK